MKKTLSFVLATLMLITTMFGYGVTSFASALVDEAVGVKIGEEYQFDTEVGVAMGEKIPQCWFTFTPDTNGYYDINVTNVDKKNDTTIFIPAVFANKNDAAKFDNEIDFEGTTIGDSYSCDITFSYSLKANVTYYIDVLGLDIMDETLIPSGCLKVSNHTHNFESYTLEAEVGYDGESGEYCEGCNTSKNEKKIYGINSISLSSTSYTYDGKSHTPSVTVKDRKGKTLVRNTDYTLTYSSKRTNVGKYTVKIKFKGKYYGTVTKTFTIKPSATTIKSITSNKKGFTVKWNKKTTQVSGYQIQYSTSSSFKNAKSATVAKNSTLSKKVTGLSGGKKYYVRVRTYKTVGDSKVYSSWSKTKTVTTKR